MNLALIFFAFLIGYSTQQFVATAQQTSPTSVTPGTAVPTTPATAPAVQCAYPPLFGDVPEDFNVFIFQAVHLNNAQIGGRLAAGGDAVLENVNIGSALPLVVCPAEGQPSGTQVGTQPAGTQIPPVGTTPPLGQLVATTQAESSEQEQYFNTVVVGGTLLWSSGSLGTGNIVAGSQPNVSETILATQQAPCGVRVNASAIDFQKWQTYLINLSSAFAGEAATGNATLQNNVLTIPQSQPPVLKRQAAGQDQLEIIDIQAQDLLQATSVEFAASTAVPTTPVATTPPAPTIAQPTSTPYRRQQPTEAATTPPSESQSIAWVFNVRGSPCGFGNTQFPTLEPHSSKILWNFVDCQELTIGAVEIAPGTSVTPTAPVSTTPVSTTPAATAVAVGKRQATAPVSTTPVGTSGVTGILIPGSILAPLASVNGSQATVDGQLLANNLWGSLIFNNVEYNACLASPIAATSPATQATVATAAQPTSVAPGTAAQPTSLPLKRSIFEDASTATSVSVSALGFLLVVAALFF